MECPRLMSNRFVDKPQLTPNRAGREEGATHTRNCMKTVRRKVLLFPLDMGNRERERETKRKCEKRQKEGRKEVKGGLALKC